jgi:hypothetical protein
MPPGTAPDAGFDRNVSAEDVDAVPTRKTRSKSRSPQAVVLAET